MQWVGYIKDYDGGTLMECVIVQRLPHTRLPAMLQAQKRALDSRIRQYSKSHVAHPGLSAFQEGCRHVDISSIPGLPSINGTKARSCGPDDVTIRKFVGLQAWVMTLKYTLSLGISNDCPRRFSVGCQLYCLDG